MSIDSSARDEERALLEQRARELEEERQKFAEATIKLGQERETMEVRNSPK